MPASPPTRADRLALAQRLLHAERELRAAQLALAADSDVARERYRLAVLEWDAAEAAALVVTRGPGGGEPGAA